MGDFYNLDNDPKNDERINQETNANNTPGTGFRLSMDNEFHTTPSAEAPKTPPTLTSAPITSEPFYRENIKPQKEKKGGFAKFVAVAALCAVVGAPLLGVGIGAGNTAVKHVMGLDSPEAVTTETPTEETEPVFNNAAQEAPKKVASDSDGTISAIFKATQASVVNITTTVYSRNQMYDFYFGGSREKQGSGTGIVFREDNENVYILTNYHVIQDANKAYVSFTEMEQVEATPVGADKQADVAVIKVSKADLTAEGITDISIATIGDSDSLVVGDSVIAIGNAMGYGKTATSGIVSALNKELDFGDGSKSSSLIQTDAAINPGNSGGALVDMNGNVIGMNTAKIATYEVEGMGFAIPSNVFKPLVESIMGSKDMIQPFLGIRGGSVTAEMVEEYHLITNSGALVQSTIEGSGAADAGLRAGDIIIELDGTKIESFEQMQGIVSNLEIGQKITVKVIRDNNREVEALIEIKNASEVDPW